MTFFKRHPVFQTYLFFLYFSLPYQIAIYLSGMSGTVGMRQAVIISLLWLIPAVLLAPKNRLVSGLIGIVLWGTGLVSLGYWLIYGQDFSQSTIFIIFESNLSEGSEFIQSYLSSSLIAVLAIYTAIAVLLWQHLPNFSMPNNKVKMYCAVISLICFWPMINTATFKGETFADARYHQINRMEPAAPWNLVFGYVKYRDQLQDMERMLAENNAIKPLKNLIESDAEAEKTFVLVLGESSNRERMSLYGYNRDTSPRLDKIKSELLIFDDVISPRPYTIESLQQVLSFADQLDTSRFYSQPNLLNMMKQAGYEVTWITNQQTQSKRNTMLTTLSKIADNQVYLNNNRAQNAEQYDEVVLEPLAQALASPMRKKMIIVHLLGTHRKYNYRYPESFEQFSSREGIPKWVEDKQVEEYNEYDNAMLYNDFVVSEIIDTVRNRSGQAALVYLADHGEDVFDAKGNLFCGRNEAKPTTAMYTVPFIFWANDHYRNAHNTNDWQHFTSRPYLSADFIHTWSDLTGISHRSFDATKSIISADFDYHTRLIGDPAKTAELQNYDVIFSSAVTATNIDSANRQSNDG